MHRRPRGRSIARTLYRLAAAGLAMAGAGAADGIPSPVSLAGAQARLPPALEIRFLDVGQGDAVLIRSGGRAALVDTGPSDAIVGRLRQLGVDTVDLLVSSHNHADHIGGADAILDALPVRFYLENGVPVTTRSYERVLERVERTGVPYLAPRPRGFTLGKARLRIVPSPAGADRDDQNDNSLAIVVELGAFRALLTGDSGVAQIHRLLADTLIGDVDLLKAAHHGSRDGVTPAWLFRTRPEVVVISLGARNPYGHPHAFALRYYCAGGRRVYRTDRHGDVAIRVGAEGTYEVIASRKGAVSGCVP